MSFDQDPSEQANISGADLAIMVAELKSVCLQRDGLLAALEVLHKVCSIDLAGKDSKQHTYFETRSGHFVEASKAMESAEAAIASAKGKSCPYCDGTGDVHRADGEWLGECNCTKGVEA